MTELTTEALKKSFHEEIINLYKKITKMVKYKPTRLMDYINKYGGYEAAVKYISTESNVQDFAVLWEHERLDLSVEALITQEKYRPLFSEDILAFCDRKLKEYSYAPNKIEEVKESSGYIDEEETDKINIEELLRQKELLMPQLVKKDYKLYQLAVPISIAEWKTLLTDEKVVTPNNLDLILRIYTIGDEVGPKELAKETGYSATYPYKEVMTALGKRIKTKLGIEVPVGEDKKPLWWHIIFNGGLKDNNAFEWSVKTDLRQAINDLLAEGKIQAVEVASQKDLQNIAEKVITPVTPVASTATKEASSKSAFDLLFESIILDKETPKEETKEVPKEVSQPITPNVTIETHEKVNEPKTVEALTTQLEKNILNEVRTEPEVPQAKEPMTAEAAKEAKEACIQYYGAICDLCGFDFGYTYGEAYEHLIQVHNIKETEGEEVLADTDPIKDLIPVCHNCHCVIHSQTPAISIEQMRKMVKA